MKRDFETLWDGLSDNLRNQITVDGEAICHSNIIAQALTERIEGEVSEAKYAAALEVFAAGLGATWEARPSEHGPVLAFRPAKIAAQKGKRAAS
jgi:hypothetical protein